MSSKFYLPSKIGSYFRRLALEYERTDHTRLHEIITSARVQVIEETAYDNWNEGTYGHDVILFLPDEIIGELGFDLQKQLGDQICDDLNKCAGAVNNERFRAVHLELEDESDPGYQKSTNLGGKQQTNPDAVQFWTPGRLRLFVSHRDTHKVEARQLADALADYGVSAFVAHDTIEPMTTWQSEIEKGLETMEIMLALVTNDFHDSVWTNQEIGYALGKNIPVIAMKVEDSDPAGFIGTKQALKGDLGRARSNAAAIYKVLVDKLGQGGRLQDVILTAFTSSTSWDEVRARFDRLEEVTAALSDEQVEAIQEAFRSNNWLNEAWYLTNRPRSRLIDFMKSRTGKQFAIKDKELIIIKPRSQKGEEIPF